MTSHTYLPIGDKNNSLEKINNNNKILILFVFNEMAQDKALKTFNRIYLLEKADAHLCMHILSFNHTI